MLSANENANTKGKALPAVGWSLGAAGLFTIGAYAIWSIIPTKHQDCRRITADEIEIRTDKNGREVASFNLKRVAPGTCISIDARKNSVP